MTALELISLVTQVLFVGLFVVVLLHALRQRSRASVDTALLFGSVAAVVVLSRVVQLTGTGDAPFVTPLLLLLLNLAPYAMIRLAADFSGTPRWIQVAGAVAYAGHRGRWLRVPGPAAARRARHHHLVPGGRWLRRLRLRAPEQAHHRHHPAADDRRRHRRRPLHRRHRRRLRERARRWRGIAPRRRRPARRAGRGRRLLPRLRAALLDPPRMARARPSRLPRALDPPPRRRRRSDGHLRAAAVGGDRVRRERRQHRPVRTRSVAVLRYVDQDGDWLEYPDDAFIAGRAFQEQRRVVALDAAAADPENADTYETQPGAHGDRRADHDRRAPHRRARHLRRARADLRRGRPVADRAAGRPHRGAARGTGPGTPRQRAAGPRGGGAAQGGVPLRGGARPSHAAHRRPRAGGAARATAGPRSRGADRRRRRGAHGQRVAPAARPDQRAARRAAARAGRAR